MGKVLVAILALFLFLAAFASAINDGIKTWRTENTTEQIQLVTGVAENAGNVTLSYDLFQAATAEVISISSSEAGDAPVALAYTEATKVMEVGGLVADETRTLTLNYLAEDSNEVMRVAGAFLGIIIIGGCIGAVFYSLFKKGR